MTDSRYVALEVINTIYANMGIYVEVDDRAVDDGWIATSVNVGNPAAWLLDLSFAGTGRMHKVRVFTKDGMPFVAKNIHIEPSASLLMPGNENRIRVAAEGDSLTAGGYNTPYRPAQDWVSQAMAMLGIDDFANFAVGGTGFINNNGTKTTYLDRLPRLTQLNADVYIIGGCHNDSGYTSPQRQAAILTYLQALRAAQPSAFIVLCGNNLLRTESGAPGSAQYISEQDAYAAFTQFADPYSLWVPILTSAEGPWITGTGSVESPANDGNMDRFYSTADGHPLQRGVDYIAQRYVQALKAAFMSLA
jgi:lysophospholipase L1-like esterase